MKQLAILVCLLCAVAAPARAASRNIHENVDPYTGLRTLFLEVSTHTCPGDPSRGYRDPDVQLIFTAMENPDHTVAYLLAPELDQAGYTVSLHNKDTMDTLIDGAVGVLTTSVGSTTTNRFEGGHSYRHETIPFAITIADLTRLSTAEWFQFRINGQRYAVQRCTDAKRLRDVAEFVQAASEYGPPESFAPAVASPNPNPRGQLTSEPVGTAPRPFLEKINPTNHLKTLTWPNIATTACAGDPEPSPDDAHIRLSVSANQRPDGGVWYYLTTDLSGGASIGLRGNSNLPIQIDAVPGSFHTIKGSTLSYEPDAAGAPDPHEKTAFHIHQADLVALNKSSVFSFQVNTPSGPVRRCATPDQFQFLGNFIRIAITYEPSHRETATAP